MKTIRGRARGHSGVGLVALVLLASSAAYAEEPAATAVAPASESPPAALVAPSTDAAPVAAPVPAPASATPQPGDTAATPAEATGPHKVLLLPFTFTVYQSGVGSFEAVPDWTEAARKNLGDSARSVLSAAGGFEIESMPELPPDQAKSLRDHVAVARLIALEGTRFKGRYKKAEWHEHRGDFDRSFGSGLKFLHDQTGADYALLIDGTQVKQSGGSIFLQLLLAAGGVIMIGGGGTVVSMCLIDLNDGEVTWFNSSLNIAILGMTKADMRDAPKAREAIATLFTSYPAIPALAD